MALQLTAAQAEADELRRDLMTARALTEHRGRGGPVFHGSHGGPYAPRRERLASLDGLATLLRGRRALFLDMFDTLVRRRVDPPHVVIELAVAAALPVLERHGLEADAPGLLGVRNHAEDTLRKAAKARGDDPECVVAGIWAEVLRILTGEAPPALVAALVAAELAVERAVLEPMPGAAALLAEARRLGLKVCVLSDTYYAAGQLRALLAQVGLEGFTEVFSSGELGKGKYSGALFDHALALTGLTPSEVLHAGDNGVSDWEKPRAAGLTARHLVARDERRRRESLARDPARAAVAQLAAETDAVLAGFAGARRDDALWEVGFRRFGPSVYAFARELRDRCGEGEIADVYFLARDGYVLREAFDALPGRGSPRSHYLYVSRKSVQAARGDLSARARLAAYLESEGFFAPGRKMIADVGWHGAIQATLFELFGARPDFPELDGLYLGRAGSRRHDKRDRNRFHPGVVLDERGHAFRPRSSFGLAPLVELATGAPHGTTLGYRDTAGGVAPILAAPDARELAARALREGARDFALAYEAARGGAPEPTLFRRAAASTLLDLHARPTAREARAFGKIAFDFGTSDAGLRNLVYADLSFIGFVRLWLARGFEPETWRAGAVACRGIPVALDEALKAIMRNLKRGAARTRRLVRP